MFKRYTSYFKGDFECEVVVISEPKYTNYGDCKTKSAFMIRNIKTGSEIECVIWKNINTHVGDTLRVVGQKKAEDRIFLARSVQIMKRAAVTSETSEELKI